MTIPARHPQNAQPVLTPQRLAELAVARAEIDAGLAVPLEDVISWVESWDTGDEKPMPQAARHQP